MASILISDKSFILSISLGAGCYRHIKISESDTLSDLHTAILSAFKIDDNHAHAFFLDNVLWSEQNSYFDGFYIGINRRTMDYRLDKVLSAGQKFKYLFNFGRELVFQCNVLRETNAVCPESTVIRSKGEVPFVKEDEKLSGSDKMPLTQTMQNILIYFDAFSALYGIISVDKAFEIYNSQNETVTRQTFKDACETAKSLDKSYIMHENNEIINSYIMNDCHLSDNHDYIKLKKLQADKPFYIPEKETLLKQADDTYSERDSYFYEVVKFLESETDLPAAKADEVADEILFLCFKEESTDHILLFLNRIGISFNNINQTARFQDLLITLQDNTRLWSNRGYTAAELKELSAGVSAIN